MPAAPKTLLQYLGAPLHPSSLDQSAVILIDCQMEYISGSLRLTGVDEAVAQAKSLLDLARKSDVPVFHIVHHGPPGGVIFDPNGPFTAIVPDLAPTEGEAVITKAMPNSFAGTNLQDRIAATGRTELIIAGFMSHMCVSATTRAASDLGYRNTVVAGATATRDLPDPLGGILPADVVHRGALAMLADGFAVIVPDAAALTV